MGGIRGLLPVRMSSRGEISGGGDSPGRYNLQCQNHEGSEERKCHPDAVGLLEIPGTQAHAYTPALEIFDQLDQARLRLLR